MKIIFLGRNSYYSAEELRINNSEYFSGIRGSIRQIIEKKGLNVDEYEFAVKKNGIWELSNRKNKRSKLLIEKNFWNSEIKSDEFIIEKLELKLEILEMESREKLNRLRKYYEKELYKKDEKIRILELERQWLINIEK